ncbi:MAG: hypothetical protein H6701_05490 [Myxococcales bacterium]|nr:hypothetical protein [Myxococcales bacterium]
MRVVGLRMDGAGRVWAQIGGCVPYPLPVEQVPRGAVARYLREKATAMALGALSGVGDGLIDEIRSAGVARVRQWIGDLNAIASAAARHATTYRALAERLRALAVPASPSFDAMFRLYQKALAPAFDGMVARVEQRRRDAITVRDWIYKTAQVLYEATGFDPLEVGERGLDGLGAVQAAVPVAITAILAVAGGGVAVYITYEKEKTAREQQYLDYKVQLVDRYEGASPETREVIAKELAKPLTEGERDAQALPGWLKVLLGLGLAAGGGLALRRWSESRR